MPELPEVETVRRGLTKGLSKSKVIDVKLNRKDLRFLMPVKTLKAIESMSFISVKRRGKFLIFETTGLSFISHLGMTGHWRFESEYKPVKHDHLVFSWTDKKLIYNDPRRFGYILDYTSKIFEKFGPDPIEDRIDVSDFFRKHKHSKTNIKNFLMNQNNILGIGNIYASEILFRAGLKPSKVVNRLKLSHWIKIFTEITKVLNQAITLKGSTLKDYKNVDGKSGGMQIFWRVYARAGKPCFDCKTLILNKTIAGRSTYYCPNCQK